MKNKQHWEDRYQSKDTPWRHSLAHTVPIALAEKYVPDSGNILEIGCGTGEEAAALAKLGFKVLAIDISPNAINTAQKYYVFQNLEFKAMDFMKNDKELSVYDTALDIACLHTFSELSERIQFVETLARRLTSNGIWINLCCINPEVAKVAREENVQAPPSLSLLDLAECTNELFQLIELQTTTIPVVRKAESATNFPAWVSVWKKLDL